MRWLLPIYIVLFAACAQAQASSPAPEQTNYCATDDDCTVLESKCPYNFVAAPKNADHSALLEPYNQGECTKNPYPMRVKKVLCENQRCNVRLESAIEDCTENNQCTMMQDACGKWIPLNQNFTDHMAALFEASRPFIRCARSTLPKPAGVACMEGRCQFQPIENSLDKVR